MFDFVFIFLFVFCCEILIKIIIVYEDNEDIRLVLLIVIKLAISNDL